MNYLSSPQAGGTCCLLALVCSAGIGTASGQSLSASLQPSNYNGYNISCHAGGDGAIDLTVSGGQPPYVYEWSNSATTQDISGLAAGFYQVTVTDNASGRVTVGITLTEPGELGVQLSPHVYGNDHNISCFSCYNGSINATVSGGVGAFTYEWNDGPATEDRSGLGSGNYQLTVIDGNGCSAESEHLYLNEPARDDWTMDGNAGTTPGSQYLGTSDNKDFVFKTNGTERMRLLSSGNVRIPSLAFTSGYRPLFADSLGTLRDFDLSILPFPVTLEMASCCPHSFPWSQCGNQVCADAILGTLNPVPLVFTTNGEERMRITKEGRVGIGTTPPSGTPGDYRFYVEDGIVCRDVLVKLGAWPDYVFAEGYRLMPLKELRAFLREHRHLPGIPSAKELGTKDGVELGEMQRHTLRVVEEQALYILQLEERLERMEQRLRVLEASR